MRVVAAILAAGRGERFGADKTSVALGGRPVWDWSYQTYRTHPQVEEVFIVTAQDRLDRFGGVPVVPGGATRQQSAQAALEAAGDADVLLLHDAARPFVSHELIGRTVEAIAEHGAAAVGLPVTDTIKRVVDGRVSTMPRKELVAMQTPQGATTDLFRRAFALAEGEHTDDMALLEAIGVHPVIVPGEPNNFKITTPEDLARAKALVGVETRTGIGYDVHPFCDTPGRTLWLGGVEFPDHRPLEGHSDADVLLHAATDALLGAAGLGDIGQHFPNTDPRWRGEPSLTFLRHAGGLLAEAGWRIVNLDLTCVAESPKIMKRADEIRERIAAAIGTTADRISVKATTNERMGFVGRGEGIAALATATIATA